jgi:hypothetical protein
MPGVSTPSFPFGGAILTGLRIQFPLILLLGLFACYLMPRAGWHKVRHHAASSPLLQIHSGFLMAAHLEKTESRPGFLLATRFEQTPHCQVPAVNLAATVRGKLLQLPFVVIPSERSDEGSLPVSPKSFRSPERCCF